MKKAHLSVRPARSEDAADIAALCGQLGYPASSEQVARRLEQIAGLPHHATFVAEIAGQVAGWAHVHAYPLPEMDLHAELGGLVVDEARRRSGIGEALMAAAEDWARQKGCAELWLRSNVVRTVSHQFYATLGYEKIKTQYTFRKRLTPSPC